MSWFNFNSEKRAKNDNITNPCPTPQPQDEAQPMSLSNLLRQMKGNAMNLSAFYSGVNRISNSIAMMGWEFKDIDDNLLPQTHYLWHLFDNSELTRFNVIKNVIEDIICKGNGFIYIERDEQTAKPRTLHYSPANQTTLYYNPINNTIFYLNPLLHNTWDNGDNYLHFFMQPDITGFKGEAVINFAYKTINLANSTEKSANDYYASGSQLFGLITTNNTNPMVGTKEQQMRSLRQSWDEARSQSNGTGVIFVPQDLKYSPLSSNAKDSALLESRLYNVQEVARFLNISPVLLGDLSHTQYGSMSDAQKDLVLNTLAPYVSMIEEQCNKKLIMPSRHCKEYVDLDENSILAIDKAQEATYYNTLVSGGIMSINEARHKLGLPNVEGADNLVIPYTNIENNTVGNTDKNTDVKEDE